MADGAALRALELALLPGATLAHRSEHLRDHLAGTRDFHPSALANVLRFDQVEVVERGGGDCDTPDFHGLEHGIRVECAGASDIDPDFLELGDLDLGRELAGDGPTRLAIPHRPQLDVQLERVDLHHDTVGAIVERGEERFELGDLRVGVCEVGDDGVVRFDREPPRGELLEQLVLRRDGQLLAGRFDVEAEDPQAATARDLGVELAQRARGGVARVGEGGLARLLALAVELYEAGLGEIDLAAHLHEPGPALAREPQRHTGKGWPRLMEVRGEVYLSKSRFVQLNREREQAGEPTFANPRNAAAGSLRQLDPKITRSRGLRIFCFHVEASGQKLPVATQHELLEQLTAWGFPVEAHHALVPDLAHANTEITKLETLLPTLDYGADGVVVKVNPLKLHVELGTVENRALRWAIARKFAPEVQITKLKEIRINVGRTGALNPYAVLEPVEIGGVTVTTATLHNFDLIEAKDIRESDWVEVTRAGEVIPQVLGPVRERRTGKERKFKRPERCPVCHSKVEYPADEVMAYCSNVSCPGRILESIVHFAAVMDIRGLGYERVR